MNTGTMIGRKGRLTVDFVDMRSMWRMIFLSVFCGFIIGLALRYFGGELKFGETKPDITDVFLIQRALR